MAARVRMRDAWAALPKSNFSDLPPGDVFRRDRADISRHRIWLIHFEGAGVSTRLFVIPDGREDERHVLPHFGFAGGSGEGVVVRRRMLRRLPCGRSTTSRFAVASKREVQSSVMR